MKDKKEYYNNDNIQAFPLEFTQEINNGVKRTGYQQGMTLRDYFAGQVLNFSVSKGFELKTNTEPIVRYAYEVADAMLKERNNK